MSKKKIYYILINNFKYSIIFYFLKLNSIVSFLNNFKFNYLWLNFKKNNIKIQINKDYCSYLILIKKKHSLEKWKKNNMNYYYLIVLFCNNYYLNFFNVWIVSYLKKSFLYILSLIKNKNLIYFFFIYFKFKTNLFNNLKKNRRIKKKIKKKKWISF